MIRRVWGWVLFLLCGERGLWRGGCWLRWMLAVHCRPVGRKQTGRADSAETGRPLPLPPRRTMNVEAGVQAVPVLQLPPQGQSAGLEQEMPECPGSPREIGAALDFLDPASLWGMACPFSIFRTGRARNRVVHFVCLFPSVLFPTVKHT